MWKRSWIFKTNTVQHKQNKPRVLSYFNLKTVNIIQTPQQLPMTYTPTDHFFPLLLICSGKIRMVHLGMCSISGGWQCHRKINNPMAYFCYYPSCYCFMVQPCPCASTRIHQIIAFCCKPLIALNRQLTSYWVKSRSNRGLMSAVASVQTAGACSQDCDFSVLVIVPWDLMMQDGTLLYSYIVIS